LGRDAVGAILDLRLAIEGMAYIGLI